MNKYKVLIFFSILAFFSSLLFTLNKRSIYFGISNNIDSYIKDKYDNEKYVFKSCQKEWIVIMEKLKTTKTNENRKVIDSENAYFRANKLRVIEIVNKFNPNIKRNSIVNSVIPEKVEYIKNQKVVANNYENDENIVFKGGIHYFKNYKLAYYYELDKLDYYSGKYISYDFDGVLSEIGQYKNGIKIGLWKYYARWSFSLWYLRTVEEYNENGELIDSQKEFIRLKDFNNFVLRD